MKISPHLGSSYAKKTTRRGIKQNGRKIVKNYLSTDIVMLILTHGQFLFPSECLTELLYWKRLELHKTKDITSIIFRSNSDKSMAWND